MKRDLELVKLILEHFEAKSDWQGEKVVPIEGYAQTLVDYHIQILYEAGLLNAEVATTAAGRIYDAIPFRLTWEGHEFLDNVKDKTRWKKILQTIKDKGGSFSFELVKQLASKFAEQQLLGG